MKADNTNNFAYHKKLQPLANVLRKNMTKAEACLWKYILRAGKMKGYTFRRQRAVLNYIADFMSTDLKLIIEVDGITHDFEKTIKKDEIKQIALESVGFTVIRFADDKILNEIDNVRKAIEIEIDGIERKKKSAKEFHPLNPRQRGTK